MTHSRNRTRHETETAHTDMQIGLADKIRRATAGILAFALPSLLSMPLLKLMGFQVSLKARIGFSFVLCDKLVLQAGSRIGHFNFIKVPALTMHEGAKIGHMNVMRGPVHVALGENAEIGNRNVIARAGRGVTSGNSVLHLGNLSKITASHSIDCTASVTMGPHSILAGKGSQIWTHGYVHSETGAGRYRVDGPVTLGSNVYIGSRALITGGVSIADAAIVGAGVCVSQSLKEPGFYVSAPIRVLSRPEPPDQRANFVRVDDPTLSETVYEKRDETG